MTLRSNKNLQIYLEVEATLENIYKAITLIHPGDRLEVALAIVKGAELEIKMSQARHNEDIQSAVEILYAMKDAGYKSYRMAILYEDLAAEKFSKEESEEPTAEAVSCFNSQLFAELEAILPDIVEEWWSDENYWLLARLTRAE